MWPLHIRVHANLCFSCTGVRVMSDGARELVTTSAGASLDFAAGLGRRHYHRARSFTSRCLTCNGTSTLIRDYCHSDCVP